MVDIRSVEDFKVPPSSEILQAIFSRQKELAEKYIEIEGMPIPPWDVNNAIHQRWIKDFFWRVTEELCEAIELYDERDDPHKGPLFYEEISDALHFLIEPLVMLGITADDLLLVFPVVKGERLTLAGTWEFFRHIKIRDEVPFVQMAGAVIYQLGVAANCLKNKSWKQTQVLTDVEKFRYKYFFAFMEFMYMCVRLGMEIDDMYIVYMKKAMINKFRQDTNY